MRARINTSACIAAFLLAALAPALLVGGMGQSLYLMTLAFVVSLAHAIVLGLPFFLIFRSVGRINALTSIVGGFFAGAIPIALFTWPFRPGNGSSYSFDNVPMIIDGTPTSAGWISYGQGVIYFGCFGALAGLVFWLVLRSSSGATKTDEAGQGSRQKRYLTLGTGLAAVAICLAGAVLAVPIITKDRTCHNMARDGGGTFRAEARILLPVDNDDWPRLRKVFDDFSIKHELLLRDFNQARPDRAAFFLDISLCNERGTIIQVNERNWSALEAGVPPTRGVGMLVYEVRRESEWRDLARDLVSDLEAAWPGKVRSTP